MLQWQYTGKQTTIILVLVMTLAWSAALGLIHLISDLAENVCGKLKLSFSLGLSSILDVLVIMK